MKATGQATWTLTDGRTIEADTITCFHCNTIVVLRKGADIGGFCCLCVKPICGPCADKGSCDPFERKLERVERGDSLMRSMSRMGK